MTQCARLFIERTHHEPFARFNDLAPSAYGLIEATESRVRRRFGFGAEKTTDAMFGHGLIRGAELVWIDDPSLGIEAITTGIGTRDYLAHIVKWLAARAVGLDISHHDNVPTWQRLLEFYTLGKLDIREPSSNEENRFCSEAYQLALQAKAIAVADYRKSAQRYSMAGVFATEEHRALSVA